MRFTGAAALVFVVGCATAGEQTDDPSTPTPDGSELPSENPGEDQIALTVEKQGTGVGTVTSSPAGIDCGATCTASFDADTVVTLTAAPTTGTTFMGWSGGCSGTATCSATVSTMATVSAMFSCDPGTQAFAFTGAAQTFVPPVCVTAITVDAFGAQGGQGLEGPVKPGGLGARIQGTVPVTATGVTIIVGGLGANQSNGHGGGGGASWVYGAATDAMPLIVAAGGGGASSNSNGGCIPGPGSATTTPTASTLGSGSAVGGVNGAGGTGGAAASTFSAAGGGSGWLTDGLQGGAAGGIGGKAPRNGGAGGVVAGGASGGFGGGGAGFGTSGACGGGGGFNGGGGGNAWNGSAWGCGGGGGSFNASAAPVNTAGVRAGNGQVTLTW